MAVYDLYMKNKCTLTFQIKKRAYYINIKARMIEEERTF